MAKKSSESKSLVTARNRLGDLDGDGKVGLSDAKAALTRVGRKLSGATDSATNATRTAAVSVVAGTKKSAVASKQALVRAGTATMRGGRVVGKAAVDAGGAVARGAGVVGTTLLDLNNDGKIDEEDLRIATERGIAVARQAADEFASSETVKSAGKAGIVVATIAIPVPLIGPAGGFVLGAGGYLTVKAVKEIGEAIGTAIGGVRGAPPPRRKKKPIAARS